MPTYQYACTACGHQLEAVQSFTDDALTECPQCQGRLRKQFSAVGVVFKGSGFYRTDSRSTTKSSGSSTSSASSASSSESKSSDSSTASKPAAAASSGASSGASAGASTKSASSAA
ncbi:FmdB family transcriptional regulator [Dactylosporangium aurantiacum]|uniref:FmdB family transcriptional regulator n=1 Tax=Dactylosporangium aurantiacum TaxID=35754 RepID=A0A9Q9ILZ7_9ACTN|nr:FmdB family transcriptional regulator [Dactylosporangium aurantiacum]